MFNFNRIANKTTNTKTSNVCVICQRFKRRRNRRKQLLSSTTKYKQFDNLVTTATSMDLFDFGSDIEAAKKEKKPVFYHAMCKLDFENLFRARSNKQRNEWHKKREARKIALQKICAFIQDNIITDHNSYHIKFLQDMYQNSIKQCYVNAKLDVRQLYVQPIKDQVFKLKCFKNKLHVITVDSKPVLTKFGNDSINIQSFTDRELFDRCAYR